MTIYSGFSIAILNYQRVDTSVSWWVVSGFSFHKFFRMDQINIDHVLKFGV